MPAQIAQDRGERRVRERRAWVKPVRNVEVTGFDIVPDKCRSLARHVGAQHRSRVTQSDTPPRLTVACGVALVGTKSFGPREKSLHLGPFLVAQGVEIGREIDHAFKACD